MSNLSNRQSPVEGRARAALLVIDVQQGLFRKSTKLYNADELLNGTRSSATASPRCRRRAKSNSGAETIASLCPGADMWYS